MKQFAIILICFLSIFIFRAYGNTYLEIQDFSERSINTRFDSLNVRFEGNWPFGYSKAVAFDSIRDLAFCGNGGGVYILAFAAPSNPILVSDKIRTRDFISGLFYESDSQRLYVAARFAGLEIWDVSDPLDPERLGCFQGNSVITDVFVSDFFAYVADDSYGLRIIDVALPTNPQEVGSLYTGASEHIFLIDSLAFTDAYNYTLLVINVSNPAKPEVIGSFDPLVMHIHDIYATENYVYIADLINPDSAFRVIDISDPTNPYQVGNCDTIQQSYAVYVVGSYAYVLEKYGFAVVDISDPATPQLVGYRYYLNGEEIIVSDSLAYVAAANKYGLRIIDVSTPTNPQLLGQYPSPGPTEGIFIEGQYAYITHGIGLSIIDISLSSNPIEIGTYEIDDDYSLSAYVVDTFAYVGSMNSGLWIVNIKDKAHPQTTGNCPIPGYATDVFVSGDYAYICDGDWPHGNQGLRIIDVSDPRNPFQIGFFPVSELGCEKVYVRDTLAYLAAVNLYVINVVEPGNPQQIAYYHTPAFAQGIDVQDSLVYLADGDMGGQTGLRIFNISDPENPYIIGYYHTGRSKNCDVNGSLVYMACGSGGIKVLDVSNPTSPVVVGYHYTTDYTLNIQFSDPYIFAVEQDCGLQIYQFYGAGVEETEEKTLFPPSFKLLQNPVRGNHITVQLQNWKDENINLSLYNLLGQRIKTFHLNKLSSGENKIRLQTQQLPSGIYFLKLEGQATSQPAKVTVLR